MFAQAQLPPALQPEQLDQYLEQGWFRMGQTIFTTNFLHFKNQFYSAIWLRLRLRDFTPENTQLKLNKRNAHFTVTIQQASVTTEKENLFAVYKQSVSFEASASLDQLLYGKTDRNIYNTYEVDIYDRDRLIAVGYFDVGQKSAEGITSFYDPAYKKYSLGKYLIYLKINYCKQLGLTYFYPGYFVPGYSLFDYKVDIGQPVLEYLQLRSNKWIPYRSFSNGDIPIRVMHEKLSALQVLLEDANLKTSILWYEYFDANLIPDLWDSGLFDFPVFLSWGNTESLDAVVIYDVRDERYHLVTIRNVWKPAITEEVQGVFSSYLLKIEQDVFQTTSPGDLVFTLIN